MKKIAIFGAGGFGREIKVLIEQINAFSKVYDLIGFFDDGKSRLDFVDGLPILGGIGELNNYSEINLVIAIGNPEIKKKVIENISNENILFPNLFHPNVEPNYAYNYYGYGNIVCSGTFISLNVSLGNFVSVNAHCTLGHDAKIGNFSSLMPSVNISGNVDVGEEVFIGVGAVTNNDITIANNVTIGAGSVVLKSINNPCIVIGNPAREMIKK